MKQFLKLVAVFVISVFFHGCDSEIELEEQIENQIQPSFRNIEFGSSEFQNVISSLPFQETPDISSLSANTTQEVPDLIMWDALIELNDGSLLVPYFDGDKLNKTALLMKPTSEGEFEYFLVKQPIDGGQNTYYPYPDFQLQDIDHTDPAYSTQSISIIISPGTDPGISPSLDPILGGSDNGTPQEAVTEIEVSVDDPWDGINSGGGGSGGCDYFCAGTILDFLSVYNDCFLFNGLSHDYCERKANVFSNLQLTEDERNWLEFEDLLFNEIADFIEEKNFSSSASTSATLITKMGYNNLLNPSNDYTQSELELAEELCAQAYNEDPVTSYIHYLFWSIEYNYLVTLWKQENCTDPLSDSCEPNLGKKIQLGLEAEWNIIGETVHTALDICGFVFDLCDPINGVIYTIEGDGVNATISFAATIPIAGILSTSGRVFYKAVKYGDEVVNLTVKGADDIYTFGSRGKMASIMKPAADEQCHHIINWARNNHDLIQRAAQDGWHPSDPLKNGINLPKTTHCNNGCGHSAYTANLKQYLDDIWNNHQDLISTPELANELLERVQQNVKDQLSDGKLLDEIIFFD